MSSEETSKWWNPLIRGWAWFWKHLGEFLGLLLVVAILAFIVLMIRNLSLAATFLLAPGVVASLISLSAPRVGYGALKSVVGASWMARRITRAKNQKELEDEPNTTGATQAIEDLLTSEANRALLTYFSHITALFTALLVLVITAISHLVKGPHTHSAMQVMSAFTLLVSLLLLIVLFLAGETLTREKIIRRYVARQKDPLFKRLIRQLEDEAIAKWRLFLIMVGISYAIVQNWSFL